MNTCGMPGCRHKLDPEEGYETDMQPDGREGTKYRDVCRECYNRVVHGAAVAQGWGGAARIHRRDNV